MKLSLNRLFSISLELVPALVLLNVSSSEVLFVIVFSYVVSLSIVDEDEEVDQQQLKSSFSKLSSSIDNNIELDITACNILAMPEIHIAIFSIHFSKFREKENIFFNFAIAL